MILAGFGFGTLSGLGGCGGGFVGGSEARNQINRAGLRVAAEAAVDRLYASEPEAIDVIDAAQALLVFPEIVKGGLVVGASVGDGVWFENEGVDGYYRSSAVSYGLQAGITTFGYIMAFMDQGSVDYVKNSDGWEVGVGPVVTVADDGFANRLSTTTLNRGVVVFFVDQVGFFAGTGIEGTKVTQL